MWTRCVPILLVAIAFAGCDTSPPGVPRSPVAVVPETAMAGDKATPQATGAEGITPAAAAVHVAIDNFAFAPRDLTVAPGTRVTWINHDDVPHTATSNVRPRAFDSGALDTDATFSFVFQTPGTYEYFCAVHPNMTGKVIVK